MCVHIYIYIYIYISNNIWYDMIWYDEMKKYAIWLLCKMRLATIWSNVLRYEHDWTCHNLVLFVMNWFMMHVLLNAFDVMMWCDTARYNSGMTFKVTMWYDVIWFDAVRMKWYDTTSDDVTYMIWYIMGYLSNGLSLYIYI